MKVKNIIVGGGISGLACAKKLSEAGEEYILIERSNRVGGRGVGKEKDHVHLHLDHIDPKVNNLQIIPYNEHKNFEEVVPKTYNN